MEMSSPQSPTNLQSPNSMESDNLLNSIEESLNNSEKKLRRIHNIRVLLDKKYISAKQAVSETIDNIRDEFMCELDDTLNKKIETLEKLEQNILSQCSALKKSINEPSAAGKVLKQVEDSSIPSNVHLLSFLSLDFVINDWKKAKDTLGYIKCSPTKPEDLKLAIRNESFHVGGELQVLVTGGRPWYPLLINSLAGYIEDTKGNKQKGTVKDMEDSDYLFTFSLNSYGLHTVSITLYGHQIENSPRAFVFSCPKEKSIENTRNNVINGAGDKNGKASPEKSNKISPTRSPIPSLLENDRRQVTRKEQEDDMGRWMSSKDEEENSVKELEDSGEESGKDAVGTIKAQLIGTVTYQNGVDLHFPIGVAVTPSDDVIICDTGHHLVWIVDKTGRPKKKIEGNGRAKSFVRPSAVSVLKDGNFVVKDNSGLHMLDHNGTYIRGIGTGVLTRPFGLTTLDGDRMVTLCETQKPMLYIFDKDGQIDRTSVFEPLINRPPNSKCRFMASYQEEVVVSDLGLSKMYKTTLDGRTALIFGRFGKNEGCMIEPSGIAVDPKGTMLIGDSKNDRVQIFDWNGEFLGVLHFSHPIHRPSDITMTKDGRLFVLNYLDHYLGVYRLSHE